jgi:hypothetical protein
MAAEGAKAELRGALADLGKGGRGKRVSGFPGPSAGVTAVESTTTTTTATTTARPPPGGGPGPGSGDAAPPPE